MEIPVKDSETRKCKNPECGKDYEPQYLEVMSLKLLRGAGFCPECAQAELKRRDEEEKAQLLADISRRRREARARTGIPDKFMNEDFSTFKYKNNKNLNEAFHICWEYAEVYPIGQRPLKYPSLYIFGDVGLGKTHLSCAIGHRLLDRWTGEGIYPKIIWVSEPDLYQRIQASYNYTAEERQMLPTEDDIIKGLQYCDLLILDDVGKEKRQDPRFIQRTLFKVINGRYDHDLPMIITANLNPTELKLHLGSGVGADASFDRFFEMCEGEQVHLEGESYRKFRASRKRHE